MSEYKRKRWWMWSVKKARVWYDVWNRNLWFGEKIQHVSS